MLSLAALTAAAQLDDDAPSGYVASYSEGEHTVQSELFWLPPGAALEKKVRDMASEVHMRWAHAVDWIGPGSWCVRSPRPEHPLQGPRVPAHPSTSLYRLTN